MQISEAVLLSTSTVNILLILHNSSDHTQAYSIIVDYIMQHTCSLRRRKKASENERIIGVNINMTRRNVLATSINIEM